MTTEPAREAPPVEPSPYAPTPAQTAELRDRFAIAALPHALYELARLAGRESAAFETSLPEIAATFAYEVADAMLAARYTTA